MKNDDLLNTFNQKGIAAQKEKFQNIKKKKAITPIDSGALVAIKGGAGNPPTKPSRPN